MAQPTAANIAANWHVIIGAGAYSSMEIAELQCLEATMRDALAELYARASTGERSADLVELAQHVRELLELLDEGLADITADPGVDTLRAFAKDMAAGLAAIEWELAGSRLQMTPAPFRALLGIVAPPAWRRRQSALWV